MPKLNVNEKGLAIGGYDVVAYFAENKALQGTSAHAASHGGATYHFSSAANRDAFMKEPERYLPAFGGFCPFGVVAMGQCAPVDPKTFRIQNGRLLLFFNDMWEGKPFNTAEKWDEDPASMLTRADGAWPTVSAK